MAEAQKASEIAGDAAGLFGENMDAGATRSEANVAQPRASVGVAEEERPRRVADGRDGYRDERPRRPNARITSEDITMEMLARLKRSRSGHQGHLARLANKISDLLTDSKYIREVKELSELFERQWDRFELVHSEILICASHDRSTIEHAVQVYNEQSRRKIELQDKVTQYIQGAETGYEDDVTVKENLHTVSKFSDKSDRASTRSTNSSIRSTEARRKREKAELSLRQLRERQFIEKENEQRILELRQNVERQTLRNEVELAKLEEKHAIEYDQGLFSDEELSRSDAQTKFEYCYATLPNVLNFDTKAETASFENKKEQKTIPTTYRSQQNRSTVVNPTPVEVAVNDSTYRLAEAIANTAHTPPIEVIKFSGDPKEYIRFVTRFTDQVLSQPIQESRKLSRLMQYVEGAAKEAIEDYEGMGEGALEDALVVLKLRFGQPYLIVNACIGEIVDGDSIAPGDAQGMQKLADKCQTVYKMLKTMKSLDEINTDHMRRLVARLPFHNQARWRDRVSQILKSKRQRPTFSDLVEFLQVRAGSENNPLYKNLPSNPKREDLKGRKRNVGGRSEAKISSYATQFYADTKHLNPRLEEKPSSCPSCHGNHRLSTCKRFLNETIENRRKIVLQAKLCFQCLQPGHFKRYCRNEKCQVQDCGRRHHKLLHLNVGNRNHKVTNESIQVTTCDATVQTNASNVAVSNMYRGTTALPVVAVTVYGTGDRKRTTYALLDQASEATFISSKLARRLNLTGTKGTLSVKSLTGSKSINAERVPITLESASNSCRNPRLPMQFQDVIVTDSLDVQIKVAPKRENVAQWKHLADIEFPDVDYEGIELLIGADNPAAFITEEFRAGESEQPWAFKYKLGWALMGPTNSHPNNQVDVHFLQRSETEITEQLLSDEIYRFFKNDGLGVVSDTQRTMSFEDKKAVKMMEETVSLVNGHYEVGMLWKDKDVKLPNNRYMALKRMEYLKSRLLRDENLHQKYQSKIEDHVNKG